MSMMTRVAGVTFKQSAADGGKDIQTVLKSLPAIITVDLKYTTFEGAPAIKCVEHKTREVIGWIPKTDIGLMTDKGKPSQLTGFVRQSQRGFSVQLDEQKAPSPKQYRMAVAISRKNGIDMPAYDVRAYGDIWENK